MYVWLCSNLLLHREHSEVAEIWRVFLLNIFIPQIGIFLLIYDCTELYRHIFLFVKVASFSLMRFIQVNLRQLSNCCYAYRFVRSYQSIWNGHILLLVNLSPIKLLLPLVYKNHLTAVCLEVGKTLPFHLYRNGDLPKICRKLLMQVLKLLFHHYFYRWELRLWLIS